MPMHGDGQTAMTGARAEERIERANSRGSPRLAPADFGERFLRHPDLFPARQSGERWGEEQVVVRFAGSDYVCDGLSTTQAAAIRERFGALCTASAPAARPSVNIRVFRAAAADFVDDDREWEFDFDLDYAPGVVRFAGFHFMGRLDGTATLRAALWTPEDSRLVSHAIFENVLRVVAAYHLLGQGGVLLHSAAVADGPGAHVFFGPSGAGKSTVSRLALAAHCAVLSDDMNALRLTADGVVAEKVPFAGDIGQTQETADGAYPVRGLFRLEKGEIPALRAMGAASAVAALLECAPFVNRNPYRYDELVAALQALGARLPVRVLTFAPDHRFRELLRLETLQ
jgi:hypothetical protein